jgi:3-isopropylmalate/(R)-2-methylmalate dehydratase small subunit
MQPLTILASAVVPLLAANIDTDQIIPAQHVNVQGKEALAHALFANRREDPAFVLNEPRMAGRSILLAGPNFGCGSSRESAAWALEAGGFRAIVAPSLNETFANNCAKNGMLALAVPAAEHARLVEAVTLAPDAELTIDLVVGRVTLAGTGFVFAPDVEPFVRELLVSGKDELAYLLDHEDVITRFEATRGTPPPQPRRTS